MKKPLLPTAPFDNIQSFLDASRGQITIGEIPPIRSAALAAEGKKVRVALARRDELEKLPKRHRTMEQLAWRSARRCEWLGTDRDALRSS
jgi:hypothetical protein